MDSQEYITLVYKNLKGELSISEFEQLNRLTAQDAQLSELRIDIEDAWDVSGEEASTVTQEETQALLKRITSKNQKSQQTKTESSAEVIKLRKWMSAIAAVLVIGLAATWLMRDGVTTLSTPGLYTLKDNTVVTLREGSQLIVSEFDDKSRHVELTGEAFFNVTSDANRPFTVTSKNVKIEVLGTQFLVKDINNQTLVDLKEGKVKSTDLRTNTTQILTAGMIAKHAGDGKITLITTYSNLSSWQRGTYQYRNAKLGDVLEELSIIHNTSIANEDSNLNECLLNGILVGENITEVLSRIAQKYGMQVKQSGSKWILTGGKCN